MPSLVAATLPAELPLHGAVTEAAAAPHALFERLALDQQGRPTRVADAARQGPATSPWAEFFADEKRPEAGEPEPKVEPATLRREDSGGETVPAALTPTGLRIEQDYEGALRGRLGPGLPEASLPAPLGLTSSRES